MGETPYRERVWMNWWVSMFLLITILVLSGALISLGFDKSIEQSPVPSYALLALDLPLITFLLSFRKVDTEVSPEGVKTNYGVLKRAIHADDIVACEPTRMRLPLYGGLGLRLGENDWPGYKAGNAVKIVGKAGRSFVIPTNKPVELSKIINDISKFEVLKS